MQSISQHSGPASWNRDRPPPARTSQWCGRARSDGTEIIIKYNSQERRPRHPIVNILENTEIERITRQIVGVELDEHPWAGAQPPGPNRAIWVIYKYIVLYLGRNDNRLKRRRNH